IRTCRNDSAPAPPSMPMIRPPTTAAVPKGIPTTQPSLRNGANNPNPAWTADGGNAGRRRISAMALNHDPIAFPKLDDAQIAALSKFAILKTFQRGETLFAAGERDFKFFVVKSGEVEIVDRSSGEDTIVTVHGSREFTGDIDMLTGRASVVSAIARTPCEAYEISAADLRRILTERPQLS